MRKNREADLQAGLSIFELMAPEDRERARLNFSKVISGQDPDRREYQFNRKDGTTFTGVARSTLIIRDGAAIGVRGILFDVTELKRAEQEMRQLRNLLNNIIDSMPSILIGVDLQRRITQWNLEAVKMIGLDAADARGKPLEDTFPALGHLIYRIDEAIAKQKPVEILKQSLYLAGNDHFVDINIYPLIGEEKSGAVLRIDDVTQRVRIEEMMVQTEKMLSVGGLAAGMAHEINNPLAGILQSSQLIRQRLNRTLQKNQEVAASCGTDLEKINNYLEQRNLLQMLDNIREAGERAAKIVQNMLSFSRKSEESFSLHSLSELLDKTVELTSNDYLISANLQPVAIWRNE